MRIGLVGARSTGKTVYLAGLYRKYSQRIVFPPMPRTVAERYREQGITQRASVSVKATNVDFENLLNEKGAKLAGNPPSFPDPTEMPLRFVLDLSFRFKSISGDDEGQVSKYDRQVDFYDVPGEAFEGMHSDTQAILRDLEQCEVIIVTLDSETILQLCKEQSDDPDFFTNTFDEFQKRSGLGFVRQHLDACARRRTSELAKRTYPICFVLTKYDAILIEDDDTKEAFAEFFDAFVLSFTQDYPNALACVCPVSVCQEQQHADGQRFLRYAPFNLEWPFLFAAGGAILEKGYERMAEAHQRASAVEDHKRKARELEELARRDLFARILRFIQEEETADTLRAKANTASSRAKQLFHLSSEDVQLATSAWGAISSEGALKGVRVFLQGKKVQDLREYA